MPFGRHSLRATSTLLNCASRRRTSEVTSEAGDRLMLGSTRLDSPGLLVRHDRHSSNMTSAKVAPWNKRDSDGRWKRKLVGAEKMFEDWLVIDGWCEWVACVHFTDKGQMVDDAFKRAVAALSLERPSLMASIERPESDGPLFVYQPLSSMAELERRTAEITQVVEVKGSLDAGVEDILDRFYSETDKRISIEMGSSLLHLYLVHSASDSKTGKYALLLRSHHALNDFLSGMSIFDGLLAKIGHREGPDESLLSTAVQRLHPCYLDLLRDPIDHHSATEAELAQGSETMGKVSVERDTYERAENAHVVHRFSSK